MTRAVKTIDTQASAKPCEETIMFAIHARNISFFAFTVNASPFHGNPSTKAQFEKKKKGINISVFLNVFQFKKNSLIYLQCWGG